MLALVVSATALCWGKVVQGNCILRRGVSWRNRVASATIFAVLTYNLLANQAVIDRILMISLFSLFWRLTTFRIGPSDVPGVPALLPLMTGAFILVNAGVRLWLSSYDIAASLASSALILAAWWVLVSALVLFKNVRPRFVQTFVALLGVDTVITLLNVIPGVLSGLVPSASPLTEVLRLIVVLLFVWDMLAKGAIYRDALNLGPMQANLLAMCFAFGFTYLDIMLFSPVPSN